MQRSEDLRIVHLSEEAASPEPYLAIDPLYSPIVEAIHQIRQQLESQHHAELEALKRSTANQTESLYHRLSEAREHVEKLEQHYQRQQSELDAAQQTIHHQNETITTYVQQLSTMEAHVHQHALDLSELNSKHEQRLSKLKEKIDAIQTDYLQQIDNLQSKLDYQKLNHEEQVHLLSQENLNLSHDLHHSRREYAELHAQSQGARDTIAKLQQDVAHEQQLLKEKSEKLIRCEHSLKLTHDELERNQRYIRELEEKNNSIQKELFENWIHKQETL